MILGIDEVGRGPWAGPLVVGAVVLGGIEIEGLTDSKKLTKKRREALDIIIREKAAAYALGWVSAYELDEIGMSEALKLATRRAVEQIHSPYHEIIIDGTINLLADTAKGRYVTTMPKADLLIPSVSAASIIAKVARDNYMKEQGELYPEYGFAQHAGYGVAKHRAAIETYGVTSLHRLSFAPLAKYRENERALNVSSSENGIPAMTKTTRQIGDVSETAAANELVRLGHEIIARNWKTKYCEIDIISRRDNVLYFTEVKHRKTGDAGDGLAAITPKKLTQMRYAAEFYIHTHNLQHSDRQLLAVATAGTPPGVTSVVMID